MKNSKFLSFIIIIMMLISCLMNFIPAFAEDASSESELKTFTDNLFTYAYVDGGVSVYSCDNASLAVTLPDEINGKRIVEISDGAFYNCRDIEYITIGKYITKIGESAFQGCTALKQMTIPDNVEEIGRYAFNGCVSLHELTLPQHLTQIPEGLCFSCTALETINYPDTLTNIGASAFYNCSLLQTPELPEGLTAISDYAFAFCYAIESAELPSTVTTLGSAIYYGCINITEFTVPRQLEKLGTLMFMGCVNLNEYKVEDGNPTYTVKDGVLYKDNSETLFAYPCGKPDTNFTVPEGVTVIYDAAFFAAPNLTEVLFPSTLKYIGAGAFEYCTALRQVYLPEGVETLYENAFADCTALIDVHLPETLKGVGNYAFYSCDSLKEITIPRNCKTIGDYAFGYTDGDDTDEDGNPIPVEITGFKKHGVFNFKAVFLTAGGILILGVIVFLLMKTIRKNQMTPEEHEELIQADLKAEDAQYVKILQDMEQPHQDDES